MPAPLRNILSLVTAAFCLREARYRLSICSFRLLSSAYGRFVQRHDGRESHRIKAGCRCKLSQCIRFFKMDGMSVGDAAVDHAD